MIVTEIITIRGKDYKHTYSDEGLMIRKIGTDEIYSDAVDDINSTWEYEETDEKIPDEVTENEPTNN